jgi:hypothetical protein
MVLLSLLGLIETIVATHLMWPFIPQEWLLYIAIFYFLKAFSSFLGSFMMGFIWEFMGLVDLLLVIAIILDINIPFLWLALLIKGIFSFVSGLGSMA